MSQGNDFANYASSAEEGSSASEDVWFVAVASDDIKQMSVDQLDEAFRLGIITAETAVWTEGMEAWAPLGEVADLDSEDASGEHEAAPAAFASSLMEGGVPTVRSGSFLEAAHPQASHFDAQHREASHREAIPSHRRTSPGWQNPFDAPAENAGHGNAGQGNAGHGNAGHGNAGHGHASLPPAGYSMGPSSFAPVTASYAPPVGNSLAQSTGPVALNVDEDMPPVSRGRRFRPERWLLAAAGIVAVGVVAFNNKDLFSSSSMAAAEKQASAAALVTHPYELGVDKSAKPADPAAPTHAAGTAPSAEDDKDAPIGSLKGEHADEDSEAAAAAPEPMAKLGKEAAVGKEAAGKEGVSKEALRGGFAKAFNKPTASAKPAKAAKPVKVAKLARKAPSRAPKGKKPGVARAASAFDPLNGSLP